MIDKEKIKKFNDIQWMFWNMVRHGNLLQQTMYAMMIRQFEIPSPEGDNPEDA